MEAVVRNIHYDIVDYRGQGLPYFTCWVVRSVSKARAEGLKAENARKQTS